MALYILKIHYDPVHANFMRITKTNILTSDVNK